MNLYLVKNKNDGKLVQCDVCFSVVVFFTVVGALKSLHFRTNLNENRVFRILGIVHRRVDIVQFYELASANI